MYHEYCEQPITHSASGDAGLVLAGIGVMLGILIGAFLPRHLDPGKRAVRDAVSGTIKARKAEADIHERIELARPLDEVEKALIKQLEKIGAA